MSRDKAKNKLSVSQFSSCSNVHLFSFCALFTLLGVGEGAGTFACPRWAKTGAEPWTGWQSIAINETCHSKPQSISWWKFSHVSWTHFTDWFKWMQSLTPYTCPHSRNILQMWDMYSMYVICTCNFKLSYWHIFFFFCVSEICWKKQKNFDNILRIPLE